MITSLEKDLLGHISKERRLEMGRYGRTKTYGQISKFLTGDKKTTFSLINHALAIIDDKIDKEGNEKRLNKAKIILYNGFQGKKLEFTEPWESYIFKLGQILLKLYRGNFVEAKEIFNEVINYWKIESQNLKRKGKILNFYDLDTLSLKIGRSVSRQFLYLLCSNLNKKYRESLASSYGIAIKLADNLSDLHEDIQQGFINISKENIKKYNINLLNLDEKALQSYVRAEFERIKKYYQKGDDIVNEIIKKYPSQKKAVLIFKDIAHSWLKQVSENAFIENLRQFDITNHKIPKFLSVKEIIKMENFYEISFSKIISISYEQEAKNTYLIKNKTPFYNPYFHEKIFQSNEKIKKIISKHLEIKDILDLGCDDGTRTMNLYNGKKLYGIEFIEESAIESKKKGIKVYQDSMITSSYKDRNHPKGRKFDLVSLLGEMVNFVGLDTNKLLENAIKQVKDGGYFLVSCMHSKFDKTQGGRYIIWSFTKFTSDKWILEEKKIPRSFLVISKQDLLDRIKNIAQNQDRDLILKQNENIGDYYNDLKLGIYLFQKKIRIFQEKKLK